MSNRTLFKTGLSATKAIEALENSYYSAVVTFEGSIVLPLEKMIIPNERRSVVEDYIQGIQERLVSELESDLSEGRIMGYILDATDTEDYVCDYLTNKIAQELESNRQYISVFEHLNNALRNKDLNFILEILESIKQLTRVPQTATFIYTVSLWFSEKSDMLSFLKKLENIGETCRVNISMGFENDPF